MSFGRHAVVIEPEELRRGISCEIQGLAAIYEQLPPHDGKIVVKREY
jgi:hypothetical protein